jgi:cell division protein FtsW
MRASAVAPAFKEATVGMVRRHRPDYQILLFTGLLMMLGLIVMYAIGPQRANVLNNSYGTDYYTSTYFFIKQTVSLLLALGAFALLATIPYTVLRKNATKILMAGFIACIILAIAGWLHLGIAQESLGATRWFNLGPLGSLQPAEFLKFGILLFAAGFLGMRSQQGLVNDVYKTLVPLGALILAAIIFVIGVQEDMGTGLALTAIIVGMVIVAGVHFRLLGLIAIIGLVLISLFILTAEHRRDRVMTFLQGDNSSLSDGSNYHIVHAKIAIGSGGFLGVGIGNSIQATGYLPEAINDSVFAIMGETFGFVGLVVIILLFTALLLRLLNVADHLEDMRLKLIVIGVFGWLGAHVILNIAAMIGVFPLTGITLPLLSFGGTSMIFIAAALGLAFQLSRYTNFTSRVKETGYEDSRSRRGVGRSRDTGRRRPQGA